MNICDAGLALLYKWEGRQKLLPDGRYKAYLDTVAVPPVWTIYAGVTHGVREGMIVTVEQGDAMVRAELGECENAIEAAVKVPLNQHQFSALVCFVYNVGIGAFRKSTLLKELNRGRYAAIPAQLMRWSKAGGKVIKGLTNRRAAEVALWLAPVVEEMPEADASRADDPDAALPDPLPQRVEEDRGRVSDVMRESWTIWGALAAIGATLASWTEWLFGLLGEAGPKITEFKNTLGPFAPLIEIKNLLPAIIITGLAIVVWRRIRAGIEGKTG